jgi:predicted PurR-regulated permease PerM
LMLIFTPLSFGYLFAWLLYPFTVVVQRFLAGRASRALLIFVSIAVALLALTIPLRVPAQTYGNTFLATLLLFTGLALELWRLKRAGARATEPVT